MRINLMRLVSVLLLAVLLCGVAEARQRGGAQNAAPSAPAPTLDGTSTMTTSSATTLVMTVSTTQTQDLLVMFTDLVGGNAVSSVAGCGLTWTQRTITGSPTTMAEYTAPSSGIQTGCSVTVTFTFSVSNTGLVFGLHGNGSTPPSPDVNASLPAYAAASSTTYSTTNANDIAVTFYASSGSSTPSAPSGFTAITTSAGFIGAFYETLSAAQSSTTVTWPSSPSDGAVDAFKD